MDFRLDRLGGQDAADLVERHALVRQHLARQDGVRLFVEHVVLGEGAVGRIFRNRRRRDAERVQDHDDAGDAAIGLGLLGQEVAGEREISLTRVAFGKIDLAVVSAETGQILRQRQRIGVRAGDREPQDERRPRDMQLRHQSHPSACSAKLDIGAVTLDRQPCVALGCRWPRLDAGSRLTPSGREWIERMAEGTSKNAS